MAPIKETTDAITKSKQKWKLMQEHKFINTYNLNNLYRQIKHIVDKLEQYLGLEKSTNDPYILLNHDIAKVFGDSFLINILNISEILELNVNYVPRIRRIGKLSEVSEQPLVIWYVIANYMKHSYKPYLPTTVDYEKMNWTVLYEFTFDQYVQEIVGANDPYSKSLKAKGQFQEDWDKQRKETFKKIYLKWYDYLYVRFFAQPKQVIEILKKVNGKVELTDEEILLADKYEASRKRKIKRMLNFFKFLQNYEIDDKKKRLQAGFLYKNAPDLWNIFSKK